MSDPDPNIQIISELARAGSTTMISTQLEEKTEVKIYWQCSPHPPPLFLNQKEKGQSSIMRETCRKLRSLQLLISHGIAREKKIYFQEGGRKRTNIGV
jgi:hypothetical protein